MGACPLCGFTPHGGETAIEVFHYRLNDVSVQSSLAVSHDSEPRLTKAETSQSEMQPSAKDLCFFLLLISQITCWDKSVSWEYCAIHVSQSVSSVHRIVIGRVHRVQGVVLGPKITADSGSHFEQHTADPSICCLLQKWQKHKAVCVHFGHLRTPKIIKKNQTTHIANHIQGLLSSLLAKIMAFKHSLQGWVSMLQWKTTLHSSQIEWNLLASCTLHSEGKLILEYVRDLMQLKRLLARLKVQLIMNTQLYLGKKKNSCYKSKTAWNVRFFHKSVTTCHLYSFSIDFFQLPL